MNMIEMTPHSLKDITLPEVKCHEAKKTTHTCVFHLQYINMRTSAQTMIILHS